MSLTEQSIEKRIQKKRDAADIRSFKLHQKIYIMTSRFNTETRLENQSFREKNWKNGCIYCSPQEVSQKIPLKSKMIVLEMDNDKNQIYAVGRCTNRPVIQKYPVYQNKNMNMYNYIGNYRITRNELTEIEEAVFKALDQLCFYGNDHMKRGNGLKSFPVKLLVNCKNVMDIPEFLENMFTIRFPLK